jgi:hypothetical protein
VSSWVTEQLGVTTTAQSVELGLRRNPRRSHLLVSRLLGKHLPVAVSDVLDAGRALGALVPPGAVVVGFAETATGLGHAVAAACGGSYAHTTRRVLPAGLVPVRFLEEHSHATDQAFAVRDPDLLTGGPLVLVDDEISTGRTAANLARAIGRPDHVLAALLDTSGTALALEHASVTLPADLADRVALLASTTPAPQPLSGQAATVTWYDVEPMSAAFGWTADDDAALHKVAAEIAAALPVPADASTLVLGDEEHLWLPQLVAAALGPDVRTSSTTRSPAIVLDVEGYPLRSALAFPSSYSTDPAFAYNVRGFDHVVLVSDGRPSSSLVQQIACAAELSVHVVAPC